MISFLPDLVNQYGQPVARPAAVVVGGYRIHAPTIADLRAAGYYPSTAIGEVPPGTVVVGYEFAGIKNDVAEFSQITAVPEIVEPTPAPFPDGIETPVVVLQSQVAGVGIGLIATDGGELATYVDHASPRPDAAERSRRIAAAVAAVTAESAALLALLDALSADPKMSKSVTDAATAAARAKRDKGVK